MIRFFSRRLSLIPGIGFLLLLSVTAHAQPIVDRVVAVVGDEMILQSEVEIQINQFSDWPGSRDEAGCYVLNELIRKKILLSRARFDSLVVADDQIEGELNRRISFFSQQAGGEASLEEFYGKTILELKDEFRQSIREQLLTEQMQSKIIGEMNITPAEVRRFYNGVPKDSLPLIDAEVELSQIVIYPPVSRQQRSAAIEQLRNIRADILAGRKQFTTMAIIYSEDQGSAIRGGDLGVQGISSYVPEFAAACMRLQKDSISDIVETQYGFHIIQMIDRKGDLVHARHILIKPKVTEESKTDARKLVDSIRAVLVASDSMDFAGLATRFSKDEESRKRGGSLLNPQNNSSRLGMKELDAALFLAVDKLKPGEVSQVLPYKSPDGKEGYRLLHVGSRTLAHTANLTDDYPMLKDIALNQKRNAKLQRWLSDYTTRINLTIKPPFDGCDELKPYLLSRTN